jgi:hypothetical protein
MSLNEPPKKSTTLLIVTSIIIVFIMGYVLFIGTDSTVENPSQLKRMKEMTQKVQGMESQVKQKESEVIALVDKYKEKTGTRESLILDTSELSSEELEFLQQRMEKEKDLSAKSLLKEILQKSADIEHLKDKISEIEDLLPTPHIAQKGESHYNIAVAFLVDEKGVLKEEAQKIVARTALFDQLAEGFKVWNFYTGEEYGTSVTQGNASVSPNTFVYRGKKKLTTDRDNAISERDKLAENLKTMAEKQDHVTTQLYLVSNQNKGLVTQVNHLNKAANSLYYTIDLAKNFKKKGIIKSGFLKSSKLNNVSPEQFNHTLDLSIEDQLVISASDYGIKKISGIVLYPKFYKKGASYKLFITPNKKTCAFNLKRDLQIQKRTNCHRS